MEAIGEEQFEKTKEALSRLRQKNFEAQGDERPAQLTVPIDKEFDLKLLETLADNPVELQKDLAIRAHSYLTWRMEFEAREFGKIGEETRKWAALYNDILSDLHKNLHGTKELHMIGGHVTLTHAHVAQEIRTIKAKRVEDLK